MGDAEKAKGKKGKTGVKVIGVVPAEKTIKGRITYDRDWDYKTGPGGDTVVMVLPAVQIEFYGAWGVGKEAKLKGTSYADDEGAWEIKTAHYHEAYIKVKLEHKDGKIVKISGYENWSNTAECWIQKDKIASGKVVLDSTLLEGGGAEIDLGDVKITDGKFKPPCDVYSSIVFGHTQLKTMADYDAPIAPVQYPYPASEGVSCVSDGKLLINELDAKDRSVLLHEWGHFIIDKTLGSYTKDPTWPGGALYDYQTTGTAANKNSHSATSKEYLESAWNEGVATFFSCALSGGPIYHDDYDTNLTYDLENDKVALGGHSEGSIQGALWHFLQALGVDFKEDFWKVLTNTKKRKVRTIWGFLDNYKDAGGANLEELTDALTLHGMDHRYDYLTGANKYKNVAAPATFSKDKKEFQTVTELYDEFGTDASGTEVEYKEEFFNANKKFNKGQLAPGATYADPKVKAGNKYIVPVRSEVS